MDFEVDMYLAMSWFDERLNHSSHNPILITDLTTSKRMWQPDLYFVNSKAASFQDVTSPNFMVLVYSDGYVFKSMRIDVTLSCMMDLELFPFDEHTCHIIIQSYAYVEQVVKLKWFENADVGFPISFNDKIILNDMIIRKPHLYDECTSEYPMFRGQGNWSCILGFIRMKRMLTYHLLQSYIPTTMLVCISWLSFWLDIRAAPARISLTITTLLTLVSVGNGARKGLPQVSYIKAIDIWLTTCTAYVFGVLMEYTLVNFYVGKKTNRSSANCRHRRSSIWEPAQEVLSKFARNILLTRKSIMGGPDLSPIFGPNAPTIYATFEMGGVPNRNAGNMCNEPLVHVKIDPKKIASCPENGDEKECPKAKLKGDKKKRSVKQSNGKSSISDKPLKSICSACSQSAEKRARKLDRMSRIFFPATFFVFGICYWGYYMYCYHNGPTSFIPVATTD